MLFGSGGKVIRFKESDVRAMGRTARGVRGIKLKTGEKVISLIIPETDGQLLIASHNGYGKRSQVEDFSVIGRGGQGVIGLKLSARNGDMVGATQVFPGDEVFLISDQGTLVRTRIDEVSLLGRNTQGVRLINLAGGEHLVGLARVQEPENSSDIVDDEAIADGTISDETPDN
jgi:DNA gyrase subunit A